MLSVPSLGTFMPTLNPAGSAPKSTEVNQAKPAVQCQVRPKITRTVSTRLRAFSSTQAQVSRGTHVQGVDGEAVQRQLAQTRALVQQLEHAVAVAAGQGWR